MAGRSGLRAAAAVALALAPAASVHVGNEWGQSLWGQGLHGQSAPAGSPMVMAQKVTIPKKVYIAGHFDSHSDSDKKVNLAAKITPVDAVKRRMSGMLPPDASLQFFSAEQMDDTVKQVAVRLRQEGVVDVDFHELWHSLRPMELREQLWRLMLLWDQGGVVVDPQVKLSRRMNDWLDFDKYDLVVVKDRMGNSYWDGAMAAKPRSAVLGRVLKGVAACLARHCYGMDPSEVVGSRAVYNHIHDPRLVSPSMMATVKEVMAIMPGTQVGREDLLGAKIGFKGQPGKSAMQAWSMGHLYCDLPRAPACEV